MEPITGAVYLKRGREKPVLNRHPWIFSGAIDRVQGSISSGDLAVVYDSQDRYLATGYYNARSQIRLRLLSWDPHQSIDHNFWLTLLKRALSARKQLGIADASNAFRLINAEADGLPGLIVDRYGDNIVMQCLTLGIERRKQMFVELLLELLGPERLIERSDVQIRNKEGIAPHRELLKGTEFPERVLIQEHGRRFLVDLWQGHKTGFYLDQRDNRHQVGQPQFVHDKTMLNVFAYTGGFAVYAAAVGAARIVNIDSSIPALEMAEENVALNGLQRPEDEYIAGDAFEVLRYYREEGERFDVVVLDPPKFAHSKEDVAQASRAYKDLNRLAMLLTQPGGLLTSFSCSGQISAELFQKILFAASVEADRRVQVISPLSQAPDHPILLTFPESAYLKGFLCRVW